MLEQSLKETEKKFKLIADNTQDLIAILNQKFVHEFINENAYLNVLGYLKEDVIGKRPRDFYHPDDIKRITKILKKGFLSNEITEEFRIRHKNGHYIWINCICRSLCFLILFSISKAN